jgi:hypothetical protein
LWKDIDGQVVHKRPSLDPDLAIIASSEQQSDSVEGVADVNFLPSPSNSASDQASSLLSNPEVDQPRSQAPLSIFNSVPINDDLDDFFWDTEIPSIYGANTTQNNAPFEDVFLPDTGTLDNVQSSACSWNSDCD